ncbi:MAG: trypsin-like peptidase domain-containing protein, partial [Candidatus Sumerlaeaceae bacterium]|nr:trypsin-like peptidase domain-containing protein [Candidatus Sumerlaeaceae bacterium]
MKSVIFSLLLAALCLHTVHAAESSTLRRARGAVVMVRSQAGRYVGIAQAMGSGFFIAPDLVLTCAHMTQIPTAFGKMPVSSMTIYPGGSDAMRAAIVARDPQHDLVLLRVADKCEAQPYTLKPYDLGPGDDVSIVGNFTKGLRVSNGELLDSEVLDGFAMASAKVYSGYSGGPVLDKDGYVQGVLSQRDDSGNSVFVRSDVILRMLRRYERNNGEDLNLPKPGATIASAAPADRAGAEPVLDGPADIKPEPAAATAAKTQSAPPTANPMARAPGTPTRPYRPGPRDKTGEDAEIVDALPRPRRPPPRPPP